MGPVTVARSRQSNKPNMALYHYDPSTLLIKDKLGSSHKSPKEPGKIGCDVSSALVFKKCRILRFRSRLKLPCARHLRES
jgi:hypothetical protein